MGTTPLGSGIVAEVTGHGAQPFTGQAGHQAPHDLVGADEVQVNTATAWSKCSKLFEIGGFETGIVNYHGADAGTIGLSRSHLTGIMQKLLIDIGKLVSRAQVRLRKTGKAADVRGEVDGCMLDQPSMHASIVTFNGIEFLEEIWPPAYFEQLAVGWSRGGGLDVEQQHRLFR
jgi:hypothetical protein